MNHFGFSVMSLFNFGRNAMRKILRNRSKDRKGQALVEYALIIAGVALVGVVGISMLGHKTGDMIGTLAAILPGAHTGDSGPIAAGQLVPTTTGAGGVIIVDQTQAATPGVAGLNDNVLGGGNVDEPLVVEQGQNAGP